MGHTFDALSRIDAVLAERLGVLAMRATRSSVRLPPIRGVPAPTVGRLLHRLAVEASSWGPLLQLEAAPDLAEDVADALAVAAGGWLHVPTDLRGDAGRVRCVVDAPDAPPLPASVEAVAAIRRWDPHHAVAADPALVRVRDALLGHCARGEVVLVQGAEGSGRCALIEWARAMLGGDGWTVVRDLEQRDRPELGPLLQRIWPPPPPSWRPSGTRPAEPALAGIVGRDPALCEALALASRHARSREPLLVLGDSGTGKEPLARAVHAMSGRRGPLVAVDLSSRAPSLVADDLFGRAAGAYSDAREARDGAFRRADHGTLLLDELGNLSLEVQAQLLRVLETGEVQPLGSDRTYRVDLRVVAATNADLEALVLAGRFRADLLHRFGRARIRLPPLRERADDIDELALHFLRLAGREEAALDPAVSRALRAHTWPGNVRELKAVMTFAATEAGAGPLRLEHLGPLGPDGPLLVTAERLDDTALTPRERHALRAVAIAVEPIGSRGAGSVRHAVLTGASGRLVRPGALRLLERWPWWGHAAELDRRVAVLRAFPGPVDVAGLLAAFPELAAAPRGEPILALLHPTLDDAGQIAALRSVHSDAGVVIGRVGSRAAARAAVPEATAWVDDVLDGGSAAWLAFPHLPQLSRVHVLIGRTSAGLFARAAPDAALDAWGGPVGEPAEPLIADTPTPLGTAGRIVVLRENEPYLEVFVALGTEALVPLAASLAARPPRAPAVTVRDERGNRRVWRLEPDEVRALNAIVASYLDAQGPFSAHLTAALREGADLQRLRDYLAPHPTAYCGRLYDHPANDHLRSDLARRLSGREDAARRKLPAAIARVVTPPHLVLADSGDL